MLEEEQYTGCIARKAAKPWFRVCREIKACGRLAKQGPRAPRDHLIDPLSWMIRTSRMICLTLRWSCLEVARGLQCPMKRTHFSFKGSSFRNRSNLTRPMHLSGFCNGDHKENWPHVYKSRSKTLYDLYPLIIKLVNYQIFLKDKLKGLYFTKSRSSLFHKSLTAQKK